MTPLLTKKQVAAYLSVSKCTVDRIVAKRALPFVLVNGRRLRHELVHHINGIKTDNRPENLMVCYGMKDHCRFHKRSHQKNGQK